MRTASRRFTCVHVVATDSGTFTPLVFSCSSCPMNASRSAGGVFGSRPASVSTFVEPHTTFERWMFEGIE